MTMWTPVAREIRTSAAGDRPIPSWVRSTSVPPPAALNRASSRIARLSLPRWTLSALADQVWRTQPRLASVSRSWKRGSACWSGWLHSRTSRCSCGRTTPRSAAATGPSTVMTVGVMARLRVKDDDRAGILAGRERPVSLVDLGELVPRGDELVDLEPAGHVQLDQLGEVRRRPGRAVTRSDQADLLPHEPVPAGVDHVAVAHHAEHDDRAAGGDRLPGGVDRTRAADSNDRVLDAVAGDPPDLGGNIAVGSDRVTGAHRACVLELVVREVDGDDRIGGAERGSLDGVEADPSAAEDRDAGADRYLGRSRDRADPGHHRAADERGDVERHVVAD